MYLSGIPILNCLGIKVWNYNQSQIGEVVGILEEDRCDYSVVIDWENGNKSIVWHFWCNNLEVVEGQNV